MILYNITKLLGDKTFAEMERELGFGNGTIRRWEGSSPSVDKVQKVSEYLGVSVEYLLTGKESGSSNAIQTNNGNIGVMGQSNAPITIHDGKDKRALTKEESELLNIFDGVDVQRRVKLLQFAFDIREEQNSELLRA